MGRKFPIRVLGNSPLRPRSTRHTRPRAEPDSRDGASPYRDLGAEQGARRAGGGDQRIGAPHPWVRSGPVSQKSALPSKRPSSPATALR
jgi:hypothetical protein